MKRKIMDRLIEWKNKASRMPLILNGARQVGKTYILKEFGDAYFDNTIYLNFEANSHMKAFFEVDLSPSAILRNLEISFGEKILPEKTLLILDEIQACERALTSLKYFREEAPEYTLIAAGSLLGVAINREKFSFPVGNVETLTLFPMDFEEFLWSQDEKVLADEIVSHFDSNAPMTPALHEKALDLYRRYLVVGGMPAVVAYAKQNRSFLGIAEIQNMILNDYIADMAKYATLSESVKIRAAYNSIPIQLAKENKKFQYKLAQKGGTAAIFGTAIDWLQFAGIVLKCVKIEHAEVPLTIHADLSSFKLYMGDVGLLTMKSDMPHSLILSHLQQNNSFIGAICENYVAQALAANNIPLYYWVSKDTAEIDFILQVENGIVPVEVKAGIHTKSRSVSVFKSHYKTSQVIRISSKNFGYENQIKSVPLYAVFCITQDKLEIASIC
jgi:hypothetical protein